MNNKQINRWGWFVFFCKGIVELWKHLTSCFVSPDFPSNRVNTSTIAKPALRFFESEPMSQQIDFVFNKCLALEAHEGKSSFLGSEYGVDFWKPKWSVSVNLSIYNDACITSIFLPFWTPLPICSKASWNFPANIQLFYFPFWCPSVFFRPTE